MRNQAHAQKLADSQPPAEYGSHLHLVEDTAPSPPANGERRTVVITGQPVPARRRASRSTAQLQARPDRVALWAVLLGLFLVFMAVATAHAGA